MDDVRAKLSLQCIHASDVNNTKMSGPQDSTHQSPYQRQKIAKYYAPEHKSGNISETRKDIAKDTMDGLQELTNALSNGTIPDPLRPPLPNIGVRNPHAKFNRYYLRNR